MKTEDTRGTRGKERGGQDGPLEINECILTRNLYNTNKLRVYTLSAKKKKNDYATEFDCEFGKLRRRKAIA